MARSFIPTAALTAFIALAGCTSISGPKLPTEQWSSKVTVAEREHGVALAPHETGLSGAQRSALSELALDWAAEHGGPVTIGFSSAFYRPPLIALQAAALLGDAGIDDVTLTPQMGAQPGDPITVRYTAAEAVAPLCGRNIGDYMNTNANRVDANFGCAVTANLAVQAADPRDLLGARRPGPGDAQRTGVILGKYRAGDDTTSAAPAGFGANSASQMKAVQ